VRRLMSLDEPSNCTDVPWLWPGVAWRLRSLAPSSAPRSSGSVVFERAKNVSAGPHSGEVLGGGAVSGHASRRDDGGKAEPKVKVNFPARSPPSRPGRVRRR
jgi:hypothetical protein